MMLELIKPDIKFIFNKNSVVKYDELKLFTKRIKEIIFILVLELPDAFKFYEQVIQDKIEQEIKKLNCIFNANFLLINSTAKLQSFKMEKL